MKKIYFLFFFLSIVQFSFSFNNQPSCTSFLRQSDIKDIVVKDKYLYAATGGGLVRMDTATLDKVYYTKENSGLPHNSILKLKLDQSGNIWMITERSLVVKFDGSVFTSYDLRSKFNVDQGFYLVDIETIGNKVYVNFDIDKIFVFNNNSWSSVTISYAGQFGETRTQKLVKYQNFLYLSIRVYSNMNSFIDYVKYDGTTFSLIKSFPQESSQPASNQNGTATFTVDNSGNIWLTQFEGAIKKLDIGSHVVTTFAIPINVRNCPNLYIVSIIYFNNKMYCGGAGKNGLLVFNIATSGWSTINETNSTMPRSDVQCITVYSANTIYLGNELYVIKTTFSSKQITKISLNKTPYDFRTFHSTDIIDNKLYIGGSNYFGAEDSLKVYDLNTQIWKTYKDVGGFAFGVQKIRKDNHGVLWMCSRAGLYYLNSAADTWTKYSINKADTIREIYDVCFDKMDNIWLYSIAQGIIKISSSGTITTVFKDINLSNQSICYDGDNYVYANNDSPEGILKINISTNEVTKLNTDNYGDPINYMIGIFRANDTVYYYNFDYFGKIHNGSLVRKLEFEPSNYPRTPMAPIWWPLSVSVDKSGKIYMTGNYTNKLVVYDGSEFSSYDYTNSCLSSVRIAFIDDNDRMWVQGDGLYLLGESNVNFVNHVFNGKNEDDNSILISPNPATESATVTLPIKYHDIKNISLINAQTSIDQEVDQYVVNGNKVNINMTSIPQGVYLLKIEFENGEYVMSRFVKM